MEALNYCPNKTSKESHKTGKGNLIWRMAREQFQKDKKKVDHHTVPCSHLSVFLCLITLIASRGRVLWCPGMDNDLTILDDTVRKEDQGMEGSFDNDSYPKSKQPIRKDVHPQMTERIVVPGNRNSQVYGENA
ncbi:MAG: hypothetical protein ACLVJO_04835 [[Clostridium] scindens]